jgi:putative oxidoreductase
MSDTAATAATAATATASGTTTASRPAQGQGPSITSWVLLAVLALQLTAGGLLRVGGSRQMMDMFAGIGVGQWFRYLVGALQIVGAAG